MKTSIYKIQNKVNGKNYIGITTSKPEQRLYHHKFNTNKIDIALYLAARKYGWDNFSFNVIYESWDHNHCLTVMETHFIKEYNSHIDNGMGYNMTYGGEGCLFPSNETRWKIGTANRGKKLKPLSEETKRKISIANSQKKRTESEKEHLRQINLGKKQSEETKLKRCKFYIITDPNGTVYDIRNLTQFCKDYGLNQGAMSAIARGVSRNNKHKGWTVKFKNITPQIGP